MKSMNYSLIRTICALVIGLVLVLWPDAAINYIVITIGVLFLIPGFIVLIGYFGTKPERVCPAVSPSREWAVCYSDFGWSRCRGSLPTY